MEVSERVAPSVLTFQPATTKSQEIALALNTIECLTSCGLTAYVAVPVTGGPRFIEWYESSGSKLVGRSDYREELRRQVIEPNTAAAKALIAKLASASTDVFINPANLNAPSWGQDDYRHFWGRVIQQFAARAIFLDGWHQSIGCIYEFFVASAVGIPVTDQRGNVLSNSMGRDLAREGLADLKRVNADVSFGNRIIAQLD
jgi:hypothetical protein